MSTLYIRLPSRTVVDGMQPGTPLYCQYAVSGGSAIEREGVAALSELGEVVARARRVVLLLAASDVTLLRVKLPPLTAARLRAALPNLVEDQLMSDPAECVVVAGATVGELRTVGVVQRAWLDKLGRTLLALGARSVAAVPAQLCLPPPKEAVTAAVAEHDTDADVSVRLAEQEGLGLSVAAEQHESLAFEVLQLLAALVPQAPVTLYVPQSRVGDYQSSLHLTPALEERVTLHADNWMRWVTGAQQAGIDLIGGLGMAGTPRIDWRPWRWPAALAAVLLLVNAVALNIDWLRMKREADTLHNAMVQTYKSAFPKETVIVDPLAQLRQKMAASRRESGQLAADDFLALAAGFGEAWNGVAQGAPLAALEYRDRSLLVKLKPDSKINMDQLRSALATRNLRIEQGSSGAWMVRSAR